MVQDIFKMMSQVIETIDGSALTELSENSMVEATGDPTIELKKVQIIYYIYRCVLDANNHIYRLYEET